MAINYKKLWHILVDRELKKKDLRNFYKSLYETIQKGLVT